MGCSAPQNYAIIHAEEVIAIFKEETYRVVLAGSIPEGRQGKPGDYREGLTLAIFMGEFMSTHRPLARTQSCETT